MEVYFWNQNCVCHLGQEFSCSLYLSVVLSPSCCMFPWRPSSSIHNSVSKLFIHLAFLLWFFFSHILLQNLLDSIASRFDIASSILQLIVGRIFNRCFETSYFVYIAWSCLGIFYVLLLSLVFFGWSPQAFFLSSSCASSVWSEYLSIFRFTILACCRSLSVIQVWVPIQVLTFCQRFSREHRFFQRLTLLLRILNRLTPWCRLSGYLTKSRLLSRFQTWLSSSLSSWVKAMWFSFQTWFF